MAKRRLLILTLLCLCTFSVFSLSSANKKNEEKKNELNRKNEEEKKKNEEEKKKNEEEKKKNEEEKKRNQENNQENNQDDKNFMSFAVYMLGTGARYERLLSPKLSVGGDVYFSGLLFTTEVGADVFVRYYPLNNGWGLYGELGLGLHTHSGTEDVEYTSGKQTLKESRSVTTTGVAISPGLGWKFDPGNVGGFFVAPGISIPITIGQKTLGYNETESGVSAGFVIYCGLGWTY